MVGVLHDAGYRVQSLVVADPMEAAGVNDRAQLAVAEAELRDRINERWMRRGVTMWDPERTYVDAEVELAADVVVLPGVILRGRADRAGARDRSDTPCSRTPMVAERAEVRPSRRTGALDRGPGPGRAPSATLGPGAVVAAGGGGPAVRELHRGSG